MKNLAGDPLCDKEIEKELTRCGVPIVRNQPRTGEVPSSMIGKMDNFTFHRAWYYWVVDGRVPLDVAKEIYEHPVGKTDIRAGGDCGCRSPETWAIYIHESGKELSTLEDKADFEKIGAKIPHMLEAMKQYVFVEKPAESGAGFITTYHIDSELGLYLFVDILKRRKVVFG